jgi:hypothetical protein
VVSGVNATQVQVVFHALTQVGEGLGKDVGHHEQGRAGVKVVPVSDQTVATSARPLTFFCYGDLVAVSCQPGGSRDTTYASTNHQDRCHCYVAPFFKVSS